MLHNHAVFKAPLDSRPYSCTPGIASAGLDYVSLWGFWVVIGLLQGDPRLGVVGLTAPPHTRPDALRHSPLTHRVTPPGVPFATAEGGAVERDCGLTAPINIVFIQVCLEPMDNPLGDRWREGRRG